MGTPTTCATAKGVLEYPFVGVESAEDVLLRRFLPHHVALHQVLPWVVAAGAHGQRANVIRAWVVGLQWLRAPRQRPCLVQQSLACRNHTQVGAAEVLSRAVGKRTLLILLDGDILDADIVDSRVT